MRIDVTPDHNTLAHRYVRCGEDAPGRYGKAKLVPVEIGTGIAASVMRGMAHLVDEAAVSSDSRGSTLAARWLCGGGTIAAYEVTDDTEVCARCIAYRDLPSGPVVYRCYDADDVLIYVGSSINFPARLYGHKTSTRWWGEVARVDTEPFPTEAEARHAEHRQIEESSPRHNKWGVRRPIGGAA